MQVEVDGMLDQSIKEPSNSPWASPVVLVKKKVGTVISYLDYRQLNAVTGKDIYPLPPWIGDSLDSLGTARFFSMWLVANGYW